MVNFYSNKKGIGTLPLIAGIIIIAIIIFATTNYLLVDNKNSGQINKNYQNEGTDSSRAVDAIMVNGIQTVELSMVNYNYYPDVIRVKKDIPVKIVADTSKVQGCYRSFTIPSMQLTKTFNPSDNSMQFTPTQTGTFAFSCSMGMGKGKLIVI